RPSVASPSEPWGSVECETIVPLSRTNMSPSSHIPRPASTPELLGVAPEDRIVFRELVELLGVPRSTAARYTKRSDFPDPDPGTPGIRVWSRTKVQAWAKQHLPIRKGRPPKPKPKDG